MSTTGKRKLADSAESSTAAPTAAPLSIVTATAGSKGRKQKMEDVTVTVDWLDAPAGASVKDLPARRRAFYAILDGHGGRDCADWVAERLPVLLAARLGGAEASSAIKEAVKQAFAQCDEELLVQCARHGWTDGCCCIGMLLDLHCSPPRAYVANLGDSRAYAAVDASVAAREAAGETVTAAAAVSTGGGGGGGGGGSGGSGGGGGLRAVALSKDHNPEDAKERRRIAAAGGFVEAGRVGGCLEVSRSLGDPRFKPLGVRAIASAAALAAALAASTALPFCLSYTLHSHLHPPLHPPPIPHLQPQAYQQPHSHLWPRPQLHSILTRLLAHALIPALAPAPAPGERHTRRDLIPRRRGAALRAPGV